MDWRDYIHSDPDVLGGKPVFRVSRYAVGRLLKLVGAGWSIDEIGAEYPGLGEDHVRAAALFAAQLMRDESYVAADRRAPLEIAAGCEHRQHYRTRAAGDGP